MKRYAIGFGILAAMMVAWSSTALAHEECEDDSVAPAAVAERPKQQPAVRNVTIKLFQFQPGRIEIKAGSKVTWLNEDEIFHTVTAEKSEGDFNGSLYGKGKSFSLTFDRPGSFSYYCERHEHMRGEIVVR